MIWVSSKEKSFGFCNKQALSGGKVCIDDNRKDINKIIITQKGDLIKKNRLSALSIDICCLKNLYSRRFT